MKAGTKLVSMSTIVPARTWSSHELALPRSVRYNIWAHIASAGKKRTASLAVHLEMTDLDVEHVLGADCVLAWTKSCWNTKNEEGMLRWWKFTKARQVSWIKCRGPDSSVIAAGRSRYEVAAV